jgi:membrane associated rhomboid family serine protease
MADASPELLEIILRECAAARPQPWYPGDYARATGVARDALDPPLDQLRLAGLVRLTDWVQGKGQGYAITPAGEEVLGRPRLVGRLREGDVPAPKKEAPEGPASREARPPGWERAKAIKAALTEPAAPVVTRALIIANVIVFAAGMALAQQDGVMSEYLANSPAMQGGLEGDVQRWIKVAQIHDRFGGLNRALVIGRDEWWRLLTWAFVHAGLLHLGMNMLGLYWLGPVVERMWGRLGFLAIYVVSAVGGGCAVLLWSTAGGGAVGASGAICGMLGSMATWVLLNRPYMPDSLASSWMRSIMMNVILVVFISMMPGVSAAGHFGGGLAGLVAGVPLTYARFGEGVQRWVGTAGFLILPVVALGYTVGHFAPERERASQSLEVSDARARFLPGLEAARKAGWEAFEVAQSVYNKGAKGKPVTAAEASKALGKVREAESVLNKVKESLRDAPTYEDARVNQALEFGKEYVDAWLDFFRQFRSALNERGEFNEPPDQPVVGLLRRVERQQKRLDESVLARGP